MNIDKMYEDFTKNNSILLGLSEEQCDVLKMFFMGGVATLNDLIQHHISVIKNANSKISDRALNDIKLETFINRINRELIAYANQTSTKKEKNNE